jgi:hypothetical protein
MATEGATRTVTAYGVSEKQTYEGGQWVPDKSSSVSAYNMTEQSESSNASASQTIANIQGRVKASECSPGSTVNRWHSKLLSSFNNTSNSAGDPFTGLNDPARNILKNLASTNDFIQSGMEQATSGISGSINNATAGLKQFEQEAIHDIQGWGAGIKKALEPVGLCSAVGDLTDLAKNPLGAPQFLANSLTSLVGKINPGFVEQMDSTYKSLNLEGLSNLPSKMMGSIRNLATAADAILSVPFEIMSDVYNGLMEILEAIADLIDGIVTIVMNLAMAVVKALLDAIIPVDELLEFFSAIGDLASFIGDISGMVGGFDLVTDLTSQVGDFASSATSLINNPLQAIPGLSQGLNQGLGAVGQITGALRNPEQFLPPEIGNQMKNISKIPGLGFVGNLGYSVGDTLDTLSDGVFVKALDKFADKIPMINSAFNKPQTEPPAIDTQENHPDAYQPPKAGPHQTAQGIPAPASTSKILPEGLQKEIDKSSVVNRFAPPPDKPWLNQNQNLGVGPTVDNAKKLKPVATKSTQGMTYQIPGGTVSVPSSFSLNP